MGRVATQMLLDRLKNPTQEITRIELPTELIVRGSTSAPKGKPG
jgi:DNA-binding LacI/PurR family transcriptional regulator